MKDSNTYPSFSLPCRIRELGLWLMGLQVMTLGALAGLPDPWRYQGFYPTGASLHAVWAAGSTLR